MSHIHDMPSLRSGARARRRAKALCHQPPVTLWTVCWWTAVGVFAGAVLSACFVFWRHS